MPKNSNPARAKNHMWRYPPELPNGFDAECSHCGLRRVLGSRPGKFVGGLGIHTITWIWPNGDTRTDTASRAITPPCHGRMEDK